MFKKLVLTKKALLLAAIVGFVCLFKSVVFGQADVPTDVPVLVDTSPLPDILDLAAIGKIALVVGFIIQYIKTSLPTWLIKPWLQFALGIFVAWALTVYVDQYATVNWLVLIVNGILAAIVADGGYSFLSNKGTSTFSLPTKSQLKATQ